MNLGASHCQADVGAGEPAASQIQSRDSEWISVRIAIVVHQPSHRSVERCKPSEMTQLSLTATGAWLAGPVTLIVKFSELRPPAPSLACTEIVEFPTTSAALLSTETMPVFASIFVGASGGIGEALGR